MKNIVLLLFLFSGTAFGQTTTLTLEDCLKKAKANYPVIKEKQLIQEIEANNIKGYNKNWLPRLSFNAQATYQSEVTSFNMPGFDFPAFPKDQYQNVLLVEQSLFDGNTIKQQKEVERINTQNELQKNEVELYKLADRVNSLYSNLLLARENLEILSLYKNDIGNKKSTLSASLQNGLVLESNVNTLEAEELKTEQNMIEVRNNIDAMYLSLGMLINQPLDDSTKLTVSVPVPQSAGDGSNRPEMKLFASQTNLLEARYRLVNKAALPKLNVFGEGIYGRPGYNFLDQSMRFYGRVGVSLKWNISTLYGLSKEKQGLLLSKQLVDVQKETFSFNLKNTLYTQNAQIKSLQEIIEKDKLIVEKRHRIREVASSQLENGAINSTDYLTELNAEMQAVLNQKVHEIKLMNAVTNYNTTQGIPNF